MCQATDAGWGGVYSNLREKDGVDQKSPTQSRRRSHPIESNLSAPSATELSMPKWGIAPAALLALCPLADAFWHGWRDQHVRVSPRLVQHVTAHARRHLADNTTFSSELKAAARKAVREAEAYHAARMRERLGSSSSNRRSALAVEEVSSGVIKVTTQNGANAEVTIPDMSLFDCPWAASLHSYLDTTAPFAVRAHASDTRHPPPPSAPPLTWIRAPLVLAYVHRSMEGFACRIRRSPSPTRSASPPSTRPPPTSTAPTMGASPGIPMRPSAPMPLGRRFFASTRAMPHRPESLRITDVPRATRGGLRARRRICRLPYARRTSRAASSRKDRLAITRMGQRQR